VGKPNRTYSISVVHDTSYVAHPSTHPQMHPSIHESSIHLSGSPSLLAARNSVHPDSTARSLKHRSLPTKEALLSSLPSQTPISPSAPFTNLSKLPPDFRRPTFFAIRHLFLQSSLKIHCSCEMEATKMRSRRRSATVGVTPIKDGVLSYTFLHVFFHSIIITIALYNARF
jgi:hypothetical protein